MTNGIGPGRPSRTHFHTRTFPHPPTQLAHSLTHTRTGSWRRAGHGKLFDPPGCGSQARLLSSQVSNGSHTNCGLIRQAEPSIRWLMTEPGVNWLTTDRAYLSNYAGQTTRGHIWIMGILPWWLSWKSSTVRQAGVPLLYRNMPDTLAALHTLYLDRQAPWAMSISEGPTQIELCKLHAMNSTRRGRIHALPPQPSIHTRYVPTSIQPIHQSSMRCERGGGRV